MAINTTAINNLLRPGLAAVFGDYHQYPSEWSEIFEVYESDKEQEIEVEMRMSGLAQLMSQGQPTPVDTMGQRIVTSYVHRYVGLQLNITRQAIKDNLYKTKFPMMVKALKKSMAQTKEILGASVLNNGFDANFPIGDGQPLFSVNHPIDSGFVANTFTVQADLNEASLESALIGTQLFKDQAGLICMTNVTKLIVPPQGQFVADRLLSSTYRTNTPNNDINSINNQQMIPSGYKTNHFLTNPAAWFLITDANDGFKHYIREPIETDSYSDFSNKNIMFSAIERYSFGVSNFRCSFASSGA